MTEIQTPPSTPSSRLLVYRLKGQEGRLPTSALTPTFDLLRSESTTFTPTPLDADAAREIPDYSESCLRIGLSTLVLDESLPNGQKLRTEAAYRVLQRGVTDLGSWLRAKGLAV